MTCGYCQLRNHEEDHRCARCGRRLAGTATAAPPAEAREHIRLAVRSLGANALAAAPSNFPRSATPMAARPASPRPREISMDTAATLDGPPPARAQAAAQHSSKPSPQQAAQPSLFGAELQPKLIPFESLPRTSFSQTVAPSSGVAPAPVHPISAAAVKPAKPANRRAAPAENPQATLDFLPPLKAAGRTLKTNADAVIFCDAKVAGTVHRTTAAALDFAMIVIAFSAVLVVFEQVGKPAGLDRLTLAMLGVMLGITALFYGVLFAIAGAVTPGMKWTHLRLISFDGFPLDGRTRAVRFAGTWISALAGGFGLLWSLLDEENLTWHDHMSKSFPTLRESDSTVVRQSRN